MPTETGPGLRDLMATAARRLGAVAVPDPRWEAARLWDGVSRAGAAIERFDGDVMVSAADARRFELAVSRRESGEPLAYVLGRWGFRHLDLVVTPSVLIPRPETEGLVDLVLQRVSGGRVADLGTGSGCIALALAGEGQFGLVVGTDASADAIRLAAANAESARLPVRFLQGSFGTGLASGAFDAIVSNPPYLSLSEYDALDPSVRDHEPRLALESGADGLEATRMVLRDAARALRPGGTVAIEIDASRAAASAWLAEAAGFVGVGIHRDLFGRDRYLVAQRSQA